MIFGVVSDIHARVRTETPGERFINGVPAPLYDVKRLFAAISSAVVSMQLTAVLILGDLFHSRKMIDVETLITLVRLLAQIKAPVYVMAGNHDLADNLERVSSVEALPHVRPILEPHDMYFGTGDKRIFTRFVPYDRDEQKMIDQIGAQPFQFGLTPGEGRPGPDQRKLLLTHGTIQTVRSDSGDYAENTTGIPLEALAKYNLTLTGHWHTHQVLCAGLHDTVPAYEPYVPPRGAGFYLGSPYPHNIRQANQPYGFWAFDTSAWTMTRVPTPGPVYRSASTLAEVEAIFGEVEPHDLHLRVTTQDAQELSRIDKVGRHCRSYAGAVRARVVTSEARKDVSEAKDDEAALAAWLRATPGGTVCDPEYLLKVGIQQLRGA